MFSNNLILILIATSAVHGLYTPRNRFMHARHAAIHARVASPQPVSAAQPVALPLAQASAARVKAKRSSKKCKPRPTSISPSVAPSASAVPVNVGQAPSQVESPKATPTPQAHQPPPSTPPPAAPAPPPPPPPPAPKPTTHANPPPAPTPAPAPKPPSSGNSNLPFNGNFFPGGISGGDGTFYTPGLGACGGTNNENQDVVAIPFGLWDQVPGWDGANPNNNPICGKSIDITYQGKTVTAVVVDECMGCTNNGSCDMSPHAFNQLADPSLGRIHGISWKWHT